MEKSADSAYPIHELIRNRWSPRSFTDMMPSQSQLLSLFEAARWAPSCYNDQPWFFIVATKENPKEYEKMLSCLVEQNRIWARQAPVLVISVARITFSLNGKPNAHAFHDLGMSIQNIALQATGMGLAIHPMAGFSKKCTRETYNIPEGYDPVTALAIGFPGDPNTLPAALKEKEMEPRQRKSLKDFIFACTWGENFISE